MIVADTTLVIAALVPHPRSEIARACARRDPVWIAPPSLRAEAINVLVNMLKRGELSLADAETGLRQLEAVVELVVYADSAAVLSVALQYRLTGYDAEFVAVAISRGLRVVTDDEVLVERAANSAAILMSSFAAGR